MNLRTVDSDTLVVILTDFQRWSQDSFMRIYKYADNPIIN
jgi:hypothetical protein